MSFNTIYWLRFVVKNIAFVSTNRKLNAKLYKQIQDDKKNKENLNKVFIFI